MNYRPGSHPPRQRGGAEQLNHARSERPGTEKTYLRTSQLNEDDYYYRESTRERVVHNRARGRGMSH